jgi:cytoskeletal protein CcmA (bactofilin family)
MFNKETVNERGRSSETIIGESVNVKGNFHGNGNIIIEGSVEGSIKTTGHLQVGEKAVIAASIEAKEASIGGTVTGNVKVDGYLELRASARVNGDIEAKELSVERGATINGRCTMGTSAPAENKPAN